MWKSFLIAKLKDNSSKVEELLELDESITFEFSYTQERMYHLINDEKVYYNYVPGWFDEIRVGYIDNEVVDTKVIAEYATIPSMEGLLTMFAGGLIEHVRNLSIGLNLYAEKLEEGGNN